MRLAGWRGNGRAATSKVTRTAGLGALAPGFCLAAPEANPAVLDQIDRAATLYTIPALIAEEAGIATGGSAAAAVSVGISA